MDWTQDAGGGFVAAFKKTAKPIVGYSAAEQIKTDNQFGALLEDQEEGLTCVTDDEFPALGAQSMTCVLCMGVLPQGKDVCCWTKEPRLRCQR